MKQELWIICAETDVPLKPCSAYHFRVWLCVSARTDDRVIDGSHIGMTGLVTVARVPAY
jgi:hypothetical protein